MSVQICRPHLRSSAGGDINLLATVAWESPYHFQPSFTFLVSLALVTKPKRLIPDTYIRSAGLEYYTHDSTWWIRRKCRILLCLGPHSLCWQLREGAFPVDILHDSRFPNPFLSPPAGSLVHGNCPAFDSHTLLLSTQIVS